jgi:hypothetical protein
MEAAPRRAALRGGLRVATGSRRRLICGCRHLIHETRSKVRASSTLGSVRSAITMILGSMATGVSRESMSTPAKKKRTHGSWKRTRCDGVTPFYHRRRRAEASTTPKSSGPALEECDRRTSFEADADTSLPRFATIKRWRVACDSVLVGDHDHLLHVPVADDGVRRAIVRRSQLLCCRRIVMQSARVRSTNTDRSARAFRESLASKIQRQCAAIARRNIGRHRVPHLRTRTAAAVA